MKSVLPDNNSLRKQVADYLSDAAKMGRDCLSKTGVSPAFVEIYKSSLAASAVFSGLGGSKLRPPLKPTQSVVLRTPLLISMGQSVVAEAELRRFVELVLWTVYFTDHPVEWDEFEDGKGGGFSQDQRKPISYASHRQLRFYLDYAVELMGREPSGLGAKAAAELDQVLRKLNTAVHAGEMARGVVKLPPYDSLSEPTLRAFAKTQRSTFALCAILFAAYRRQRFDRFNAVRRAYFDWLVGSQRRKEVRRGQFGLK